jgi:hypothetical protein
MIVDSCLFCEARERVERAAREVAGDEAQSRLES